MEDREKILLQKYPQLSEAKEYGIDIVMLYENLQRPVQERVKRHQIALDTYKKLHNIAHDK